MTRPPPSGKSLKPAQRSPRVLIIRLDYLGDMLCTTALMAAIRRKYPDCYLAVLGHAYNRPVVDDNPDLDAVYQYIFSRERERNPRPGWFATLYDRLRLLLCLRAIHFDYVIIPNGGRYMSAVQFAWQLGARHVCCIDDELAFDDRVAEHVATRRMEHETLAGFRVAHDLLGDVRPQDYKLKLTVPSTVRHALHDRLATLDLALDSGTAAARRPVVALNFSARVPERIWSVANWCRLAIELAQRYRIVVLGAPDMWQSDEFQQAAAATGLLALTQGATAPALLWPTQSFMDLAATIAECDQLISTDGGAVHVAAALGKPVVVLFEKRPEKYMRWYPWGVEYAVVVASDTIEVAGIAVADVSAACDELLARSQLSVLNNSGE